MVIFIEYCNALEKYLEKLPGLAGYFYEPGKYDESRLDFMKKYG